MAKAFGDKIYESPQINVESLNREDVLNISPSGSPNDMTVGGDDKIWGGLDL